MFSIIIQEQEATGEVCSYCEVLISGKVYSLVAQSGETIELKIEPLNYNLCERCYSQSQS